MKEGFSALARRWVTAWQQLGFNQRVNLVLATGALLAGLAVLTFVSGRTSWTPLHHGPISETEAARVVAALEEAKIKHQVRGPGSIYVPTARYHAARLLLAGKGLPAPGKKGWPLFDESRLGSSDFHQRVTLRRALEGELARMISGLDAVESAEVSLPLPTENQFLIRPGSKNTATVTLQVRVRHRLPASTVKAIQLIVANSVKDLPPANVAVVDNLGHVLAGDQDDSSVAGLLSAQLEAVRGVEQYLQRKAEDMLNDVLGPGQAVVRVAADINWNTRTTYSEKFDPEGQVVRTSTTNEEEVRTSTTPGGAAVGVAANTAVETEDPTGPSSARPLTTSSTTTRRNEQQYEVPRVVASDTDPAGSIQRLTAAVIITPKYEGTGPDRRPVPRTPEELDRLRTTVSDAIGIREGDPTRNDRITLIEHEFGLDPLRELSQQLQRQTTRHYWTEVVQRLLVPALGLVVLIMFWRAWRVAPDAGPSLELPLGNLAWEGAGHGSGPGTGAGNGNGVGHPRISVAGGGVEPKVVTVEVLNQLIRENPANMTQAVRTWLTRGKTIR